MASIFLGWNGEEPESCVEFSVLLPLGCDPEGVVEHLEVERRGSERMCFEDKSSEVVGANGGPWGDDNVLVLVAPEDVGQLLEGFLRRNEGG